MSEDCVVWWVLECAGKSKFEPAERTMSGCSHRVGASQIWGRRGALSTRVGGLQRGVRGSLDHAPRSHCSPFVVGGGSACCSRCSQVGPLSSSRWRFLRPCVSAAVKLLREWLLGWGPWRGYRDSGPAFSGQAHLTQGVAWGRLWLPGGHNEEEVAQWSQSLTLHHH